jgi:N utilization substance protein A
LAIGKQGQNVRLAAKLTGWNIDIEGSDSAGVEKVEEEGKLKPKKEDKKDLEAAILEAVKAQNEDEPKEEEAKGAEPKSKKAAVKKTAVKKSKKVADVEPTEIPSEEADVAPIDVESDEAKTE